MKHHIRKPAFYSIAAAIFILALSVYGCGGGGSGSKFYGTPPVTFQDYPGGPLHATLVEYTYTTG